MSSIPRRRPTSEGGYSCGDETSARIIAAALSLFGEKGFEGASTREIAELAGVNAPALNYYFKNKEGVYLACTEHMVSCIWAYLAQTVENAQAVLDGPADSDALIEAFWAIQQRTSEFMLVPTDTRPWRQLYAREQAGLGPTSGMELVNERISKKVMQVTSAIVARLLGRAEVDEECIIRAITLHGQIQPFHQTRYTALGALNWDTFDKERFARLMAIVRQQTVGQLKALCSV
jgi:AcrR family transcriptional regulator